MPSSTKALLCKPEDRQRRHRRLRLHLRVGRRANSVLVERMASQGQQTPGPASALPPRAPGCQAVHALQASARPPAFGPGAGRAAEAGGGWVLGAPGSCGAGSRRGHLRPRLAVRPPAGQAQPPHGRQLDPRVRGAAAWPVQRVLTQAAPSAPSHWASDAAAARTWSPATRSAGREKEGAATLFPQVLLRPLPQLTEDQS